jgi:hypothetical protein
MAMALDKKSGIDPKLINKAYVGAKKRMAAKGMKMGKKSGSSCKK